MKHWSLNKKVWCLLLVSTGMAVSIAGYSFYGLHSLQKTFEDVNENFVYRRILSAKILDNQRQYAIHSRNYIIKDDPSFRKDLENKMNDNRKEIEASVREFHDLAKEDGKLLAKEYLSAFGKWDKSLQDVFLKLNVNKPEALAYLDATDGLRVEAVKINQSMSTLAETRLTEAKQSAYATMANVRLISIVFAVLGISLSGVLAFYVLRELASSIDKIIKGLNDNSEQVREAAQQIASASEELSQAATEQASSLEETAASIEEMNSMVQKNAENARGTSDVAKSSRDSALKGKDVVEEMRKAISEIDKSNDSVMESINESNEKLSEIVNVITQIGRKTLVINDIVSQTRLLSINASVEAAKAKEHGKGFAVVATEVNNLARMSGEAAKEISTMLEESVVRVQSIVNETRGKVDSLMLSGKAKIETGVRVANDCGSVLDEIVKNVTLATEMANAIAVGSQEQAQGVSEITKAMNQLDQVTQTNASTSEEAASAAEELSAQAEAMRSVVMSLVKTIKGVHKEESDQSQEFFREPSVRVRKETRGKATLRFPAGRNEPRRVPLKMAAGQELSLVPDENDPRFKEV